MNWLPGGLALAALISITGISPTATTVPAAPPTADDRCTASDIQFVAHRNYDLFTLVFTDNGSPRENALAHHIAEDCQFRLYDDNDSEDNPDNPEVPHVFSEDDYFLGGIAFWYTLAELDEFGLSRAEAIADMKKFTEKVYWGPASATDAQLVPIDVATTPYRNEVLGDEPLVGNHRYVLFKAGTLAPGTYQWRWEQSYPGEETSVSRGAVTITAGT